MGAVLNTPPPNWKVRWDGVPLGATRECTTLPNGEIQRMRLPLTRASYEREGKTSTASETPAPSKLPEIGAQYDTGGML